MVAATFIPQNNQDINYTQVFFRWPQVSGVDEYQIKIFSNGENDVFFTGYSESNSFLLEELLSWDTSYLWEICSADSDDCFYENYFTVNPLPEHHTDQINILYIDEANYYEGINILDFESLGYSLALDRNGNEIWFADKYNFDDSKIMSVELLDNGNFTGFSNGKGYEFTVDSDIVFETPQEFDIHHQILKSSNDTYFIIDAEIEYHPCPDGCDSEFSLFPIPWQGDRFIEIDSLGEIIWEWNAFDHISLSEYNPYYAEAYNGTIEFDWTHSNSVLYDEISDAVYVSIRNLSRVVSIDYLTGQINWNLGESDFMTDPSFENEIGFSQQHSVQLTDDGNLIFFDNGRFQDPELSRCIEIGFDEDQEPFLVWEHVLPDSMFTGSRGECDRLENNTLISAGRTGNVIEVDNNNELVWHLRLLDNHGNSISVYRTQRAPNLFPNFFSFDLEDIQGDYTDYSILNTGHLNFSIYNSGWGIDGYYYKLSNGNQDIILDGMIEYQENIIEYSMDTSEYSFSSDSLYYLSLQPSNNPQNIQEIQFHIVSEIVGDINGDSEVDILDALEILSIIIEDLEYLSDADLNQDGTIDIFDLILIVNIILADNP